ncbi:MAG: 50S ribosome-binding GTPase, partial [Eubacterium sp.]|nr:50S ribosome-binding GTPase [Eubacterium sp.]
MGLNDTPSSERTHIGFFGKRNVGKSSVVNAVTGQELAVVSEIKGTTTDPVHKAMELLPLGPVMIIDTPGIDDEGMLGEKRVKKTRQILNRADIAVLVTDAGREMDQVEKDLLALFQEKKIPYVIVRNKSDLLSEPYEEGSHECLVSALTGEGIYDLKEKIAHLVNTDVRNRRIVGDLLHPLDLVI